MRLYALHIGISTYIWQEHVQAYTLTQDASLLSECKDPLQHY